MKYSGPGGRACTCHVYLVPPHCNVLHIRLEMGDTLQKTVPSNHRLHLPHHVFVFVFVFDGRNHSDTWKTTRAWAEKRRREEATCEKDTLLTQWQSEAEETWRHGDSALMERSKSERKRVQPFKLEEIGGAKIEQKVWAGLPTAVWNHCSSVLKRKVHRY